MKVRLQNHNKFAEFGEFDTKSGRLKVLQKEGHEYIKGGVYSYCENDLLAIFVADNKLAVRIGPEEVRITPSVSTAIERFDTHNVLRVFNGKKEIHSYKYITEKGILGDMTPFVDKEDDDFVLFIANVINSPERQEVFLEVHASA